MKKQWILAGLVCSGILLMSGCTSKPSTDKTEKSSSSSVAKSSSSEEASQASSQENSSESTESNQHESDRHSNRNTVKTIDQLKISAKDAIKVFQETYSGADITSLEVDTSFGRYYYDIEGIDDQNEYEARIDAETKEVSRKKQESLDRDEQNGVKRNEEKLELKNLLSLKEASKIAEKEEGSGSACDWELEKNHELTCWKVKVQTNDHKIKVKMNAQTGDIIETEQDD